jgi:hypothetical protein
MNKHQKNQKRRNIYDEYRRILNQVDLDDAEVEDIRENMKLLAQTVCEYIWKKKFY